MTSSMTHSLKRLALPLALALMATTAQAQVFFTDDFEDRAADQPLIGNNWTWFDQWFPTADCSGDPSGGFGPFSDGDPADYPQENRNFFTTNDGQDGPYFRAGLEVPAWEGALGNMMRVYGNPFNQNDACQRTLVFQEVTVPQAGIHRFSFDVAMDRFGAPAFGERIGGFVKVLRSSDNSFATLLFSVVDSAPPPATSPGDVTSVRRTIEFDVPDDMVGELLQFGFWNDVTAGGDQSWATAGAYYDNIELSAPIILPPGELDSSIAVPTLGNTGLGLMIGLLALLGMGILARRGL